MARLQQCSCGSGEFPTALHDGYGIFLCYACDRCERKQLKKYRADIMTRYDTDEQVEDDY